MSVGNALFAERNNIVPAFGPVDLSAAANTGDRVSLENYNRCTIVFISMAGTAGDDPELTLLQADAATSGNTKAVNFEVIHSKQAATSLNAVGSYTRIAQAAANTYTNATSAEQVALWVVDITSDDLDGANGYKFIQASVADVGTNGQLGACFYILSEPRYTFDGLPSALV